MTRFKRTGVREDLDRAVASGKDAVAAAPVDHPNRAAFLLNLGVALDNRWRLSADADDADTQMAALREAARLKPAPVSRRIQAARLWGRGAVERANFQDAVEGFSEAVELLGLLVHRRLGRHDQQSLLAGLQGLGQEAAAACLAAGRPDTGVELFEQSRAVLFAQALATRTDLTELQQDHPDLASRFVWCCDELARGEAEGIGMTPGSVREPDGSVRDAVEHRRVVVAELDAVLETIRSLPRYRRFLLPRPVAELLSASSEGPVVLINVTGLRSDALVLRSDGVAVVPLPAVGPDVVRDRAAAFFTSLEDALNPYQPETARADAEAGLDDVLTWLWDEVVGPVLHHARLEVPADDDAAWTRVWWCPSGPLALLPLHAAGRHHTGMFYSPEAALDRVVSSTTPTVGALIHARRRRRVPAGGRVLVVAMPRTPGHPDLPGAEDEAEIISRRLPGRVDLMGPTGTTEATLANVTAELPRHSWVHFACHSVSDIANPDASHLALQDYQTRPLTVLELMRARLEEAELAFLSACTTARGNANLPDEPIHLAAACQLAGFRHVVATLWPIRDRDAVHLAGAFYAELLKRSSSEEADAAAVALHHATRLLRQVHPEAPSRWATYTHTGG